MRLVPGDTKVKLELFKGVRIWDLLVCLVACLIAVYVIVSDLPYKVVFLIAMVVITSFLLVRITEGEPTYERLLRVLRFFVFPKKYERVYTDEMLYEKAIGELGEDFLEEYGKENRKDKDEADQDEEYDGKKTKRRERGRFREELKEILHPAHLMDDLIPFTGISSGCIDYDGLYYGIVFAIDPVEFRFLNEKEKNASIEEGLGAVLRVLPPKYCANIIKLDRPILFDDYLECEYDKLEALRLSFEKNRIDEDEYKARVEIQFDRIRELRDLCYNNKILSPAYYIALFDGDRTRLLERADQALETFLSHGIQARKLDSMELAVFLKYTNGIDFEERDISEMDPEDIAFWAMPEKVQVMPDCVKIDGRVTYHYMLTGYPPLVDNAWMAKVMELPGTKVVVKVKPVDRDKAVHDVDRSIEELKGRLSGGIKESRQIELSAAIESLSGLLELLQEENETLLEVSVFVTVYGGKDSEKDTEDGATDSSDPRFPGQDNLSETVKRVYRENGFTISTMDYRQLDAFVGAQVSAYNPMERDHRTMPSNTIAAMYPWIKFHVMDVGGIKLGSRDQIPVCIDFFRRDSERVNSNMVIVGKSGSGKSYAAKSLLTNFASEDAKIFILDPENEYSTLAKNLHGELINVGNSSQGRINPFHIMTDLDDDEGGEGAAQSYATHMQFLEEFFHQILPDCAPDALEYLNTLVEAAYAEKGIYKYTDLSKLKPEDYPTFDDVYDQVLLAFQKKNNDYMKSTLRTLVNHVGKFAEDGRNAEIWNGPSTITTDSNFTVFNFQSILANRNDTVANAQMLLVLKFIDNEIIKNRDYNIRYGLNRKVVVVIDEAHVFIDNKYPIALDFMYQLAKRIRKYNGMQIVITQNIKDFVGSTEVAAKSAAIINACQYSLIFPLAASDITDLCSLYEKAGGINEQEQEEIQNAPRGQAFTILSPQSRSTFMVDVGPDLTEMFEKENFESGYFIGRLGREKWEDFVHESRERQFQFKSEEELRLVMEQEESARESDVISFSNISFSVEGDAEGKMEPIIINGKRLVYNQEENKEQAEKGVFADMPDDTSFEEDFSFEKDLPQNSADEKELFDGERFMAMLMGQKNYERMIGSIRERVLKELDEEIKSRR